MRAALGDQSRNPYAGLIQALSLVLTDKTERGQTMADTMLFVVFSYVAVLLAVLGSLYRYFINQFSYSSLSSELVENEWLFWGIVPWHYGIVPTLLIHLAVLRFRQ